LSSFYKENATPNRACQQVIKENRLQVAEQCRGFVKYKLHESPHILRDDEVKFITIKPVRGMYYNTLGLFARC